MKIRYESISEKYVNQAVELVLDSYIEERTAIPFLPNEREVRLLL